MMHTSMVLEPDTRIVLLSLMRERGVFSYDAMIRQLIEEASEHVPGSVDKH